MRRRFLIISPQYPPMRSGLPDHTARLACELSRLAEVSVLTSVGADKTEGVSVHGIIQDWQSPKELDVAMAQYGPDTTLIWQYVPHMYGRGGVNLALPGVLARCRQRGMRQIVIAHEIAAPFSPWPHRFVYALAHRWQWNRLLPVADRFGFSTEVWMEAWARRRPELAGRTCLLPSPSSIAVAPAASGHSQRWRLEQGLPAWAGVMTYFGTLSGAKQFPWVLEAWRQSQTEQKPVLLAVIGDRPQGVEVGALGHLFRPLGFLPADQVSAALQASDLLLLPFVDGVSERRTTFMAGLIHGLPVLTTLGHNTGPSLRRAQFFAAPIDHSAQGFATTAADLMTDAKRRSQLGPAAKLAYAQQFDWPVVVERLLQAGVG